jgi:hypothetical protein
MIKFNSNVDFNKFQELVSLLGMRPRLNPTILDVNDVIHTAFVEIQTARGMLNDVLSNQDFNSLTDVLGLPPYHKPAPTDFSRVVNIARCEIEGLRELVQRQLVPDAPREWDGVEALFVGAIVRNGQVVAFDDSGDVVCIRRSDSGRYGKLHNQKTISVEVIKDHFEITLEKALNPSSAYFNTTLRVLRELSEGGYINIVAPAAPVPAYHDKGVHNFGPVPAAPIGEHFNCRPDGVKLFSKDELRGLQHANNSPPMPQVKPARTPKPCDDDETCGL